MKLITLLILAALAAGPAALHAFDSAKEGSKGPATESPKTAEARKGTLKISTEFEGTILPFQSDALIFEPKSWKSFPVLEALPHGTRVKKGETIVKVETKDLEDAIIDQKATVEKLRTELDQSKLGLERLQRDQALALENAELELERKKQDHKRLLKVTAPIMKRDAKHSLEMAQRQLESQTEELKQLTAMYKEDELTEETEEFILIRQKNRVSDARYNLEKRELDTAHALETTIPRQIDDDKKALEASQRRLDDLKFDQEFAAGSRLAGPWHNQLYRPYTPSDSHRSGSDGGTGSP